MKVVYFADAGFDYLSNQLIEGFHLLSKQKNLKFLCTNKSSHHGAMVDDLVTISEEEAADNVGDADLLMFSSGGDFRFLDGIRGKVFKDQKLRYKRVFIDGHDSNGYLCDPDNVKVYFKRELRYPEMCSMVHMNVRSLMFGVYQFLIDKLSYKDDYDKRLIDIAFVAFGGSNPLRKQCADFLGSLDKSLNVYVNVMADGQPLTIPEYREIMRSAKVGVSIPGAGLDTLRFWETMGSGAVLAAADMTRAIFMRDMPEPNRHAIYFDSWNRLLELVRQVVLNKAQWVGMRNAATMLTRCHHTTTKRAEQLLWIYHEMV